jgi:hypothetical protein
MPDDRLFVPVFMYETHRIKLLGYASRKEREHNMGLPQSNWQLGQWETMEDS